MRIIEQSIKNIIKDVLQKEFNLELFDIKLVRPPQPEMGDLSFSCFDVAKSLGKNPVEVASVLLKAIEPLLEQSSVRAAGPYLNFIFQDEALFESIVSEILEKSENVGDCDTGQGQKIMVEYSSPNTNKPQHIGHLRNNVLGDSLARILMSQGYDVVKASIINDRGIHICKSMLMYQKYGDGQTPEEVKIKPDHFVGSFYSRFDAESAINPQLLQSAQELLRRWEDSDKEVINLWKKMNLWVYQGWDETYKILKITFDKVYYESEIYQEGKKVVSEGLEKGVFYKRDDGAIEIDLSNEGLDKKVLLRADGTSVYITQDLYLAQLRFKEYPDLQKIIHVVGVDQEYHFKVLFSILAKLGVKKDFYHLSYGMVRLAAGKMSSRLGTVVNADDIIEEVVELALSEVKKREGEIKEVSGNKRDIITLLHCYIVGEKSMGETEKRALAIGLAAVKYYLLQVDPYKTIVFDAEKAVVFEGKTGPYIQYTYARLRSIISKIFNFQFSIFNSRLIVSLNKEEREVVNLLGQFGWVLARAGKEYNPAVLAHYLFELSESINRFYHQHQVLKAEGTEREKRLLMLKACGIVLKKGMGLLGIEAVEKM